MKAQVEVRRLGEQMSPEVMRALIKTVVGRTEKRGALVFSSKAETIYSDVLLNNGIHSEKRVEFIVVRT